MAFLLQNIEQQLPGELVDLGRSLYEKNAVGSLFEADKHLWTGLVTDNQAFEVEVQISPSKVKAYTCDCAGFLEDKICKHIVAFLFSLRKKMVDEKLNKAKAKQYIPNKRRHRKLSINAVLEHTSEQNLKDFIKTYARTNRPFSLALKAHFAINVPMEDSTAKYKELINTTIRSAIIQKKRLSPTGKKRLGFLIGQLEIHWETAFSQKNYREALSITIATIEYLFPLRQKEVEEERSVKVFQRLSACFLWIEKLLTSDMGPQLRKELISQLEIKILTPAWLRLAIEDNYLDRILQVSPEKIRLSFINSLRDVFPQFYNQNSIGQQLILIALKLLPASTLPESIINLLYSPTLLNGLLNELSLPEDRLLQKQLATIGLQIQADPNFHLRIKIKLLEIALLENDVEQIIELSRAIFFTTGEIKYYQVLKRQLPGDENLLATTLQQMEQFHGTIASQNTLAHLYLFEEQWDQLFQLLEQEADLDLLMQIDQEFPANMRTQLDSIYEVALRSYLKSYLGRPAARKVNQLFNHLSQLGANRLSRRLLNIIKKEFKEWKAVQQMLSGMRF